MHQILLASDLLQAEDIVEQKQTNKPAMKQTKTCFKVYK